MGLSAAAAAAQPPRVGRQALHAVGGAALKMAPLAAILQAPGGLGAASVHSFEKAFQEEQARAADEMRASAGVDEMRVAVAESGSILDMREAHAEGRQEHDIQLVERVLLHRFALPMLESMLHRSGIDVSLHLLTLAVVLFWLQLAVSRLVVVGLAEGDLLFGRLVVMQLQFAGRCSTRLLHFLRCRASLVRPAAAGLWAVAWVVWQAAIDNIEPASWTTLGLAFATASIFALAHTALPVGVSPALLSTAQACGRVLIAFWSGGGHGTLPSYDVLVSRAVALAIATALARATARAIESLLSTLLRPLARRAPHMT